MEDKSLKLMLVTGLPGTGKSTVARILAEKTNAVVINSDVVRRGLFPDKRSYSHTETGKVIAEVNRRAKESLRRHENVILDALFTKQASRDLYKKLAENLGAEFEIILVTADESVIKQRLDARVNDPSEANFAYYLDRRGHFEPIVGPHRVVENSGDLKVLQKQVLLIKKEWLCE